MKNAFITTLPQLNGLITNTYIFAIITAVVFFFIAYLAAKLIPWQGGSEDPSYIKRRIAFFIIWFISIAGFFLYNNFFVMARITNIAFQSKFMVCNAMSAGIVFLLFGILSIATMKMFPKSKFGSILG